MGRNKANLPWQGGTLIEAVISTLSRVSTQVSVVGGEPLSGVRHIPDRWPEYGPVGGIATSLIDSSSPYSLVAACDMPALTFEFLRQLIARASGHDAAIPVTVDGRQHPLCAVWSCSALPVFENAIAEGEHTLRRVIERLDWIPVEGDTAALANLNTPVEYAEAVRKGE